MSKNQHENDWWHYQDEIEDSTIEDLESRLNSTQQQLYILTEERKRAFNAFQTQMKKMIEEDARSTELYLNDYDGLNKVAEKYIFALAYKKTQQCMEQGTPMIEKRLICQTCNKLRYN